MIHLCNGGQLPFLFCSDSDNPSADNFAICTFDRNNFSIKQRSNKIYSINLTITEIW